MSLDVILSAALGVVAGAVVALTVIAPKTQSKVDDKLLKFLEERVQPILAQLHK